MHRVLDPLRIHMRPRYRGLKSWLGVGVLALVGYLGGSYIFSQDQDVDNLPETVIVRDHEKTRTVEVQDEPEEDNLHSKSEDLESVIEEAEDADEDMSDHSGVDTMDDILSNYNIAITDTTIEFPIKIDSKLYGVVRGFRNITDQTKRAETIFEWQMKNWSYGSSKRGPVKYRDSVETSKTKEGVCGEAAYLYIALARASNLKAEFAMVHRDFLGREVEHACAVLDIKGRELHVDPAYYTFDAGHQEIEIIPDSKVTHYFRYWRGAKNEEP